MPDKTKWVGEWKQKAENDLRTAEGAVEMAKAFKYFLLRKLDN